MLDLSLCSLSVSGVKNTFSPKSIEGCVLWLDASDEATITEVVGVSNWADKSGNGNDATQTDDTAYQPSYSAGGIVFDGVNDQLNTALTQLSTATVFSVINPDVKGVSSNNTYLGAASAYNAGGLWTTCETFATEDDNNNVYYTSQVSPGLDYDTIQYAHDFNTHVFWHTVNGGTTQSLPYCIGSRNTTYTGSTDRFEGTYYALLIFDRVLSAQEYKQIIGYLVQKYGVIV